MTDHLNATHTALAAATLPQCIDDIAKTLHGTPTKTQLKAVETELKKLHKAGLLESTPGRGGVHYYSLTTPTQPAEPQPRPAAVAVQAAVKAQAPSDTTEQLRESRANELALSQTIVEICFAIGRNPAVTTTGELPQLVRKHIDARVSHGTAGLMEIISDIRKAIDDDGRRTTLDLAAAVKAKIETLENDCIKSNYDFEAIGEVVTDYMPDPNGSELIDGLRIMDQLIDAQHAHIHIQNVHVEVLEQQITDLRARIEAQVKQHQADIYAVKRVAIGKRHPVIKTV